jgi:LmbE family N-acetylglucosaminyl deacetylase
MTTINYKSILVIEPHPDDFMSCFSTLSRIRRHNPDCNIYDYYACPCTEDPKNVNHIEDHIKVLKLLNIEPICGYHPRNGWIDDYKQKFRDEMFILKNKLNPELIFCSTPHDFHQDHRAISECVETIFRCNSTILGYEVMRSVMPDFKPNLFLVIEKQDYDLKMKAINMYKSQIKHRFFFKQEKYSAQMIMRGIQIETMYAEAYELMWGKL